MKTYRTTSVRALIRHNGSFLVEWYQPKQICFLPGGTVEGNESLEKALQRELAEELQGSSFFIDQYLGNIGHIWSTNEGTDSCLNHFFTVHADTPEAITSHAAGRVFRWIDPQSTEFSALKPAKLQHVLLNKSVSTEWSFVDSEI
jgi:ADP-ribose pyrophosphatase YjhB (NUDIX family)